LRVFLVTILAGSSFIALAALALHYGLDLERAQADKQALEGEVRGLVLRVAELEGVMHQVDQRRRALDELTLAAVHGVLDATKLDPESEGKLYLASLPTTPETSGGFTAQAAAPDMDLTTRIANDRQRAAALLGALDATRRAASLRSEVLASLPSRPPAKGWLSSGFGLRVSPFHGNVVTRHNGVDIAADVGTPVHATADGVVAYAGRFGTFGNYVRIDHGFGISTRYAHNSKVLVKKGQHVHRGDVISVVGSTGRSTGPHVHYEVLVHGQPVNPQNFFLEHLSDLVPAPPSAAAAVAMGGDGEIATPDEKDDDATIAMLGNPNEKLYFASALPAPLSQATPTHVLLFAILLALLALASSIVPGNSQALADMPVQTRESKAPRREKRARASGVWVGGVFLGDEHRGGW